MKTGSIKLVHNVPVHIAFPIAALGARDVWVDMISNAQDEVLIEQFYLSLESGSQIEQVFDALISAARRGVSVRVIVDRSFASFAERSNDRSYALAADRISETDGIELRYVGKFNLREGAQHSKFIVVDSKYAWVGSHNFDWRSLEHIVELGVFFENERLSEQLRDIFELDWKDEFCERASTESHGQGIGAQSVYVDYRGSRHDIALAVSPNSNPCSEVAKLGDLVRGATRDLCIQIRKFDDSGVYSTASSWRRFVDELKAADKRGVNIRLLVDANILKYGERMTALNSLSLNTHMTVKYIEVPKLKGRDIPHARMMHVKSMVVDGARTWISSANWTPKDLICSRNIGVIVEGAEFAEDTLVLLDAWWALAGD